MLSNAIILMKFFQKKNIKIQKKSDFEIAKIERKKKRKRHLTLVPSLIPKHTLSFLIYFT
jgi:hypothetical protein